MSADQRDWTDYVGLAEFNYNVAMHSATKEPPFKVAYGQGCLSRRHDVTTRRVVTDLSVTTQ